MPEEILQHAEDFEARTSEGLSKTEHRQNFEDGTRAANATQPADTGAVGAQEKGKDV